MDLAYNAFSVYMTQYSSLRRCRAANGCCHLRAVLSQVLTQLAQGNGTV